MGPDALGGSSVESSLLAKGRGGGGGGSISGVSDSWDAIPIVKAQMAFLIIWFIFVLVEFIVILQRLKFLPSGIVRRPYILLAVITFFLSIGYLVSAILLRIGIIPIGPLYGLYAFIDFVFYVDVAFRPAVILWILHMRGRLTYDAKGKTGKPFVIQFWKRVLDWSLAAIIFLFGIITIGIIVTLQTGNMNSAAGTDYANAYVGMIWTGIAFSVLYQLETIVSLIVLKVSQSSSKIIDTVTTRLLIAVSPFLLIEIITRLATNISIETMRASALDMYALNFASIFVGGIFRISSIWAVISTMKLPQMLSGNVISPGKQDGYTGYTGSSPLPPVPGLTYTNQAPYYPAPSHPPPNNPVYQQQMHQATYGQPAYPMYNASQQQQPQPYPIPA